MTTRLCLVSVVCVLLCFSNCTTVETMPSCGSSGPQTSFPDVPEFVQLWMPYTTGQVLRFAHGSDTITTTVRNASFFQAQYFAGDECPPIVGQGITGTVLLSDDSLTYRSGFDSPQELAVYASADGCTIYDTVVFRIDANYRRSLDTARTVEINGQTFPLTFALITTPPFDYSRVFVSHGVGVSGFVLHGREYSLVQ